MYYFFIFLAVRLQAKSERRYKQFSKLYQSLKYPALFLVSIVYSEEKVRSVGPRLLRSKEIDGLFVPPGKAYICY